MLQFKKHREIAQLGEKLISEGATFDELKRKIINWIQGADKDKLEVLSDVWTRMNRNVLEKPIEKVITQKNLPSKDASDIFNVISDVSSSLEDKKQFSEILNDKNRLIDPKNITGARGKTYLSEIIPDTLSKNETFQLSKDAIIKMKNTGNEARGQGETFITLFVSGTGNAKKGDIKIGNVQTEIKASTKTGAATLRLREGVNAPNNVKAKEKLISTLKSINPRAKIQENNTFSFVPSSVKDWNEALEGLSKNEVKQLFKGELPGTSFKGFKELYPQISDKILNVYLDEMIENDGRINEGIARYAVAGMFFDYYRRLEEFDQMMVINVDEHSFIMLKTGEDILRNSNTLKIRNTSIWVGKEERHASPEIALV